MKKIVKEWPRSMVTAALAGIVAIISIGFIKQPVKDVTSGISKSKVAPPFANADIEFKNYSINAQKGLKIKYFETGSVITIPDSAFVDGNGKIVKGKVDIKYREFHDPTDFFVSGIPMTYDSAGEKYHFESAGMLEMLAFQYGKPVFMNPEKRISIEMLSQQTEDKFNIYKYNPLEGNWNYIRKDKAIPINQTNGDDKKNILSAVKKSFNKAKSDELPTAPLKIDASKYHFDVAVDSAEFPELTTYKGTLFEVDKKEKDFNPLYASATWNDISLEKGKRNGCYLMTLSKGTESHSFEAVPVLEGKGYDEALIGYKKQLAIRKKKEAGQQRIKDSLFYALNKEREDFNEMAKNTAINVSASLKTESIVMRAFTINGFGIWNSDCPSSLPKGEQFAGIYTDTLGKALKLGTIYLVEKGRNAMFTMYAGSKISFNPKKDNSLWAMTDDNKLAVFEESDFKKLEIKNDSCKVKMKIIDKPIRNCRQVKELLKI